MTRRVVHLTLDRLAELGETVPCGGCVFWELDAVRRGRLTKAEDRREEKSAWLSHALREWGSCGRVVLVDDEPAGLVVYAPAAFVPGSAAFPTAPVSPDAVLMTALRILPRYRGAGLGRLLVQQMARDLVDRGGVRAVEAFGSQRPTSCLVDVDFLGRVGFRTHRAHPVAPRMRMDLKTALSWRDEVEAALDRLLGVVRPAPVPDARQTRTRRA